MKITLKNAFMLAVSLALLSEATYEFISKYEAWIWGIGLGAFAVMFVGAVLTSRKA